MVFVFLFESLWFQCLGAVETCFVVVGNRLRLQMYRELMGLSCRLLLYLYNESVAILFK